ncbi:unnamed protein product [Sympodiomycopsis kandeliae]
MSSNVTASQEYFAVVRRGYEALDEEASLQSSLDDIPEASCINNALSMDCALHRAWDANIMGLCPFSSGGAFWLSSESPPPALALGEALAVSTQSFSPHGGVVRTEVEWDQNFNAK